MSGRPAQREQIFATQRAPMLLRQILLQKRKDLLPAVHCLLPAGSWDDDNRRSHVLPWGTCGIHRSLPCFLSSSSWMRTCSGVGWNRLRQTNPRWDRSGRGVKSRGETWYNPAHAKNPQDHRSRSSRRRYARDLYTCHGLRREGNEFQSRTHRFGTFSFDLQLPPATFNIPLV
jgi:hypothetical protein